MNLALVLQDEVDDLACKAGPKEPATHGTIGVVSVLRFAVPRRQLYGQQRLLQSG